MNSEHIIQIAKELPVNYGDVVSKKHLMVLFELSYPPIDSELNHLQARKEYERVDWLLMAVMDLFKTAMRDHRQMHLNSLGREGQYKIIHPEEHVDLAVSTLRKRINRGFKECNQILSATKVDLLDALQKQELQRAQVHISRLDDMLNRKSLLADIASDKNTEVS